MLTFEHRVVKEGEVLTDITADFIMLAKSGSKFIEDGLEEVKQYILPNIMAYLPNEIRNGSYYYLRLNEVGNSMIIRKDAVVGRPIQFSPQFLQPIMNTSPISNIPVALVQ